MDHLITPGDSCFTPSEAKKLSENINKLGVKVADIRGVYLHYTHLRSADRAFVTVSSCCYFCCSGVLLLYVEHKMIQQ